MFWVIICSTTWFAFDKHKEALTIFNNHPGYVSNERCSNPQTANDDDISFYKSHKFNLTLTSVITNKYEKNHEDDGSFDLTSPPSEVVDIKPMDFEEIEEQTEEIETQSEINKESEKQVESIYCYYWLENIGLHLYTLRHGCN